MDEQEWLTSTDPVAMLRFLTGSPGQYPETATGVLGLGDKQLSGRKLLLFAAACVSVANYGIIVANHEDLPAGCTPLQWAELWAGKGGNVQIDGKTGAALLRCIVGNPFRPAARGSELHECCGRRYCPGCDDLAGCGILEPWPWIDAGTVAFAHAIYEERAFDQLPILADALEEAGCTDTDILDHLRGRDTYKECPQCVDYLPCPETNAIECGRCDGTFVVPDDDAEPAHARGCWVLDLILGRH